MNHHNTQYANTLYQEFILDCWVEKKTFVLKCDSLQIRIFIT